MRLVARFHDFSHRVGSFRPFPALATTWEHRHLEMRDGEDQFTRSDSDSVYPLSTIAETYERYVLAARGSDSSVSNWSPDAASRELLRRGYSLEQARKVLGENVLRVMEAEETTSPQAGHLPPPPPPAPN